MVKLYALAVYFKGPDEAKLLKSAYDLASFSFFQRGSVQEFMTFATKTIVERTTSAARQSVKEDVYMCHVYVRADNLACVVISDHEYPNRVAHTFITKVMDDFAARISPDQWRDGTESSISFNQLPVMLAKYQNPREADALTKIMDELDETKIILRNTIEATLSRGEKLDDLILKSEELSVQSKAFYKTAKKTNSCCNFS